MVVCGPLVASAATNIAIAADELVVRETTSWMIHEPWSLMIGSADELESEAAILRQIIEMDAQLYAQRTGKSPDEIKAAMHEETWLIGQAIVDYGFADLPRKRSKRRARARFLSD